MYYIKIITVETDAQAATSITLQLHLVEIKCRVKIIQQKTEKYIIKWRGTSMVCCAAFRLI